MQQLRKIFLLLPVLCAGTVFAQVNLRIISLPESTPSDAKIYVAGNFNGWNPGDANYELKKNKLGIYSIVLPKAQGVFEYKFTLGSWESTEIAENGKDIKNRISSAERDTIVNSIILAWKAPSPALVPNNSKSFFLLSEFFPMQSLHKTRAIWIYLPHDYSYRLNKRYPVIYMQDGQNLFDDATAANGEWGVDESMKEMEMQGDSGAIIVGIAHGGTERIDEYAPWPKGSYGGGKGAAYLHFVAHELKPVIDRLYRTKPERESTAIIGSSLGGLISLYAIFKQDSVFSKFGILSPSIWFADSITILPRMHEQHAANKIYLMSGILESSTQAQETYNMRDSLLKHGYNRSTVACEIKNDGTHSEWFWKREFPACYKWLFKDANTSYSNPKSSTTFDVKLVPKTYDLFIELNSLSGPSKIEIVSAKGKVVAKKTIIGSQNMDIAKLPNGIYTVRINNPTFTNSKTFEKK